MDSRAWHSSSFSKSSPRFPSQNQTQTAAAKTAWLAAKSKWDRISSKAKAISWSDLCRKIEDPASHRLLWPKFHATVAKDSAGLQAIANPNKALPSSRPKSPERLATHFSSVSAPLLLSSRLMIIISFAMYRTMLAMHRITARSTVISPCPT